MLKVVLEAAAEPSGLLPLLIILVAAIALVTAIFLVRYKRKG
jgi:hypothetical protein